MPAEATALEHSRNGLRAIGPQFAASGLNQEQNGPCQPHRSPHIHWDLGCHWAPHLPAPGLLTVWFASPEHKEAIKEEPGGEAEDGEPRATGEAPPGARGEGGPPELEAARASCGSRKAPRGLCSVAWAGPRPGRAQPHQYTLHLLLPKRRSWATSTCA